MPTFTRWCSVWNALGVPVSAELDRLYTELLSRYAEPQRHYHTMQHLGECLAAWDALREDAVHPDEGELALWFHDAVYDVYRDDNEAKSAELLKTTASRLGVASAAICRMTALVMVTVHPAAPDGPDAKAVVDADLAILGADPMRFQEYEHQIRQEYAWVPDNIFRQHRAALLEAFLARPHLFHTDLFRNRFEAQARENLREACRVLSLPPKDEC